MMKTLATMCFVLAAGWASATVICSGSSASTAIDSRTGVRAARAEEPIAYSTEWNDSAYVFINIDGTNVVSATAPATGDYVWHASSASAGIHTLTLNDGVETLAAKFISPLPSVGRIHKLSGAPFVGNRLVLRAKPYGDPAGATYAWKRDGVTVATTERLDIASLADGDFGTYTLTVSNPYGTATSEPYVLEPAKAGIPIGWGASGHGRTTAPEGLTGLAQVASGMNFNLGLSTNGTVTAWGYNGHGGCNVPGGLDGVSFVAAGGYESQGAGFAVKTDGSIVAWGQPHEVDGWWDWYYEDEYDEYGYWIGDHEVEYWYEYTNGWNTVATMPTNLSNVVKVAVGGECAIALKADGSVVSWGRVQDYGYWEELYDNDGYWTNTVYIARMTDYSPPDGLFDVVDVSAGDAFLMALKADGTVMVWNDGDDWYGECDTPCGLGDVVAIAAGKRSGSGRACFALKADGTIVKWGDRYNSFGKPKASDFVAVDAGQYHAMALDRNRNVHVWGALERYDIGTIPFYVTNAFAIAAGGYHCTALVPDSDGDTICDAEELDWGRDPFVWEDWHRSSLGGAVATESGPVAGALVQLYDRNGNLLGRTRTDANGSYRFGDLLPSSFTIKVKAPDAIDAWYDGVMVTDNAEPAVYVLAGGVDVDDLDFMLEPGQGPADATITGKGVDSETGQTVDVPLPDGTTVYLDLWPAETEADGTLDIGEIPVPNTGAASHTITLKLPGQNAKIPAPAGVSGKEGANLPVKVAVDGPTGMLEIATEPSGATVYVDYADAPLGVTPLSVGNLIAGSHTVLLKKDGYLRPRPVVAYVEGERTTAVAVPLNTAADTNEMTTAVTCVLPDQEIYLDYLPTGEVAPATVGGIDPASHAGTGWHSASHTILLKHPMVRPWAPRYVPEPSIDAETGAMRYDSAIDITGPQLYDDSDGDGVRNDQAIASGQSPFYTLEEALDATNLVWTAGGDRKWRAVKTAEVQTGGYGQSGAIGNGQSTWVETTVKGAGTVSFKWKTSCQRRLDMVRFSVDGVDNQRLFGETDWAEVSVGIAGVTNHVLRWTFTRGASGSAGENCVWLDEVRWVPDTAANARTLAVSGRYAVCEPAIGTHPHAWGDAVLAAAAGSYSNGLERATCTGWTGTGSVPATGAGTSATFTIEEDSTLTWTWATEYRLDLGVEGEGTLSRESDWFAEGTTVVITATPGLYQRFVRWEGDTDGCRLTGAILRAPMTKGRSIRAVFAQATCTLSVADAFGEAWPTNGLHTFDMGTEISAWSTNIVSGDRTRHLCTGWTGTGSVPASGEGTNAVFTLLEDSSIAWTWQTNYLVRVTVVGDGTTDIGEAWIEAGSNLVVTATPGGTAYTAAVWSGDIEGAEPDGLRITIPVDGPKDISIAFNALSVGRALEQEFRDWTTGLDGAPWTPVTAGTHDGVDACMSGAIAGGYGESILSATFSGPGDLSFWWRLGDSTSTCGIDLYVDGQDVNVWLVDATGWIQETISLGAGDHVVEWIFWGDGLDPLAAAWLDEVEFTGDETPLTETQTTPVHVPYLWLDAFNLGDATEVGYETAAKALSANGLDTVWECYVAGLDPTNAVSVLRATIRLEDGDPVIGYEPARPAHTPAEWYKVDGKRNLGDVWAPKAGGHRFFRVRIEVPEE